MNERILIDMVKVGVTDDKMRALFYPSLEDADFDLMRKIRVSGQPVRRSLGTDRGFARAGRQQCLGRVSQPQRKAAGGAVRPPIRTWR